MLKNGGIIFERDDYVVIVIIECLEVLFVKNYIGIIGWEELLELKVSFEIWQLKPKECGYDKPRHKDYASKNGVIIPLVIVI